MSSFDPIAKAYEALIDEPRRWAREAPLLRRLLARAGDGNRRVLDQGCGTGFHALHLAREPGAQVTATDPSTAMLAVARAKTGAEAVRWQQADAAHPPAGPFDLILLLGNTLTLVDEVSPVFEAAASVAASRALFLVQQLDFETLQTKGETRLEKQAGDLRIVKTLTPLAETGYGARLHLQVFDAAGELLGETEDRQRWHDSDTVTRLALHAGWDLREERRSYEDAARGGDRIHLFERQVD
jgi:SAM-dependent methyltransferase